MLLKGTSQCEDGADWVCDLLPDKRRRVDRPLAGVTFPLAASDEGTALDRRTFLQATAVPCLLACAGAARGWAAAPLPAPSSSENDSRFIVEAKFYEKLAYKKIKCKLCPRECVIDDRERGYCGVRENRGGTYYTLVHSRVVTAHIDPIEKKPLFHFHPGTVAFSLATAGCNVNCKMCQNWEISQVRPEQVRSTYLPPRDVAAPVSYTHLTLPTNREV